MRLLASFILASFFFLVSHQSEASGSLVPKQELVSGIFSKKITGYTGSGDMVSPVVRYGNLRHGSSPFRSLLAMHPGYVGESPKVPEILLSVGQATRDYSHCIPIGMKLLFPKHYFW